MVGQKQYYSIHEILNEKQLDNVIKESIAGDVPYTLLGCDVQPAADGLCGFLGEHIRVVVRLRVGLVVQRLHLFIKRVPVVNKVKQKFIMENKYFWREMAVFRLMEDIKGAHGPNPWITKAYIYTESLLVMPDLSVEGYTTRHFLETLDLPHVLATTASIARFHAACANYETQRSLDKNRPYKILDEYGHVFLEVTFQDSPWMRAAAKLTVNFLDTFSSKFNIQNLEEKLAQSYVVASDTMREYDEDLNVIVHKDLWINNILFNYDNGVPLNAIIIDFQCSRYGPPAFDLMTFLYLTTSRTFREHYEPTVFDYYFKIFMETVDEATERRLEKINYNRASFLSWCDKGRMFGALEAVTIFPYVLMDPKTAQRVFDDPDTYMKYLNEDRSEPVIAHARQCKAYKDRQLEVCEEYIERYILKNL